MLKPLALWITTNCGIFLKRWEYQTSSPASWEMCMRVKKQQLELDMEQWTSSKLGKTCIKAVYCHPVYLTYMQSTSCKMPGWMKQKLESRLLGEISTTSHMQMISLVCRKWRGTKEFLDESENASLKLNFQNTMIMASSLISSQQTDGEKVETVSDFISWAPKSLRTVTAATKLKDAWSLE